MPLTMTNLQLCFNTAIEKGMWVGVAVSVPGTEFTELIINEPEAVAHKLAYYLYAYTHDLKLKAKSEIYIKGFTYGIAAAVVAEDLLGV